MRDMSPLAAHEEGLAEFNKGSFGSGTFASDCQARAGLPMRNFCAPCSFSRKVSKSRSFLENFSHISLT